MQWQQPSLQQSWGQPAMQPTQRSQQPQQHQAHGQQQAHNGCLQQQQPRTSAPTWQPRQQQQHQPPPARQQQQQKRRQTGLSRGGRPSRGAATSSSSCVQGLRLAPSRQQGPSEAPAQLLGSFDHWGDSASNWMVSAAAVLNATGCVCVARLPWTVLCALTLECRANNRCSLCCCAISVHLDKALLS